VAAAPRSIVIAANSCWNILNFRAGLIRGLKTAGYAPIVAAPDDPAAKARIAELDVEWRWVEHGTLPTDAGPGRCVFRGHAG